MKISKESGSDLEQTGESRLRQQTTRSKDQLENAGAKFASKLKEPKTDDVRSKSERKRDKQHDDKPVDSAEAGRGEGIIANSGNPRAETLAVTQGIQETPVAHDVNSVAQQIATRVLVSPPGAANPEVRIQLKESVLQGSEVRIFREVDALKVVFVAPSQTAANFIAGNHNSMVAALSERLPNEQINISVETRQSEQEHGEGRSRQQYVADDDTDAP